MVRPRLVTLLVGYTLFHAMCVRCSSAEGKGARQGKDHHIDAKSLDCPLNATVLSFSWRNFVINAYQSVARRNISTRTLVSIPCRHVDYALSLLHRSVPTYLFTSSVEDHCTACNVLDASYMYLARATLDTCGALNMASFRLVYTDEFSHYQESIKREANGLFVSEWKLEQSISTASSLLQEIDHSIKGFVVICSRNITEDLIRKGRSHRLTRSRWHWIIIVQNADDWTDVILPGERIILIQNGSLINGPQYRDQMRDAVEQVYTLWTMSMSTQMLEYLGAWRLTSGLVASFTDTWTFQRFSNKTYTIATIHLPAFHYKQQVDGKVVWRGICIEILDSLAETFNFSYRLVEPRDQKWGGPTANGSWNGMIGMILRGEADFGLAKFTITNIRKEVVDFAFPFWYGPSVLVMKKPDANGLFVYLSPFRNDFWLSFLLAVPVMSFVIASVFYVESAILGEVSTRWFPSIFADSLWFTFGSVFQQGSTWLPREQASRFLVAGWWFLTVIVSATYTGNLIAALAVPRTVMPVQTLEDLASQTTYKYGPVDGTAIYSLIKESSYHVYQKLWRNSIQFQENTVKNHRDGLERVMSDNFIYMGELSGVAPVVFDDCRYAIGNEEFFPSGYAFTFPKDDPYMPLYNERIANLVENGLIQRWREIYYPKNKCTSYQRTRSQGPANAEQFQGALAMLCAGVVAASLTLFGEVCLRTVRRLRRIQGSWIV